MWYENNIFVGIMSLTIIACVAMWRIQDQAKDIVIPIVTGIAGIVTGYVAKVIKDAVTTKSVVTHEDTTNVKEPNAEEK